MIHSNSKIRLQTLIGVVIAVFVFVFLGLQLWSAMKQADNSFKALESLEKVNDLELKNEKVRQEIIALKIENEKQIEFLNSLVTNISAAIGIIIALTGGWIGLQQYINLRRREKLDRAAIDLNSLWGGISSDKPAIRASSIAGLQVFLSEDKEEYHNRVASALALAGRMENKLIVKRTLTPVIEYAMRNFTDVMRNVSWQGLSLTQADFSGINLDGFDFRDSNLEKVNFTRASLKNTRFDAARLIGAKFDYADLTGAILEYADLANVSLKNANLANSKLRHIKVLNLDLENTNLAGADFSVRSIDWKLINNWRQAKLDAGIKSNLESVLGPSVKGIRILMLMWEFPPFVSGGGWTAAYHFLKNLRKKGADITVMIPLPPSLTSQFVFGNEINIIPAMPELYNVQYDQYSAYKWYTTYNSYLSSLYAESGSIMEQVNNFTAKVVEAVDNSKLNFDVIHAHDWLTFGAAKIISETFNLPWVAHLHSLEDDRQNGKASYSIQKIENDGCRKCNKIITVSKVTKNRVIDIYEIPPDKISVVPNCLSENNIASGNLGEHSSSRIVFLGRLSLQKGPDYFIEIARKIRRIKPNTIFDVYGAGEEENIVRNARTIEEVEIPDPKVFKGIDKKTNENDIALVEFYKIVPVNYDSQTNSINIVAPEIPKEKLKSVQEMIFRRGFTAFAIGSKSSTKYCTHLIIVNNKGGKFHRQYIASGMGLEPMKIYYLDFINYRGHLKWENRAQAFANTAALIVPSRSEPFGMVILEAMQHGVPVLYTKDAGVAEVLSSGIPIDTKDLDLAAKKVCDLLDDKEYWQRIVEEQFKEIEQYHLRQYEDLLYNEWETLVRTSV